LRYVSVVVVCDAEIKKDIEKHRKVKHRKENPVFIRPYQVLYPEINTENIDRFDQEIQGKEQQQIGKKFPLHLAKVKGYH
jgi:hypothetical protein